MMRAELGDVAEFINGAAFKPEDWGEDGRRIIRIQNLNDPSKLYNRTLKEVGKQYLVPPGTLLVSWSASLGVFEWNEPDVALLNQHIFKVVPDRKKVDQAYLRHMLENALVDMARHHRGSTMVHVNRKEFLGTTIPLPPLAEQKRIAEILDQADALRRLRARALDKLNTLGQAIFHEMFGDEILQAHASHKLALIDVIQKERGISYGIVQRGKAIEGGVPVVRISNLADDHFNAYEIVRTSREIAAAHKRTMLQGGELAISIRGTVGRVAIIPREATGWNVSREVAVIPLSEPSTSRFFWELLRHHKSQQFVKAEVRGVAQSGINLSDLRKLPIPSNFIDLSNRWTPIACDINSLVEKEEERFKRTNALFSSLQHRAFRGEL